MTRRTSRISTRLFYAALALALCLPSLLLAPALARGGLPVSMDTIMYFFPLRWHAAMIVAGGEWPWWNRCIMGGMPLFSNPQAALGYPLNWPMLLFPSGFWFTFPMTLQLGAWAALTGLLLRRAGLSVGAALAGCALCLAGNYGWSRFQYGNYMNVLPWWPVWLMAALHYFDTRSPRALALAGVATAMMILSGAHQLAAYGLAGLIIFCVAYAIQRSGAWRAVAIFIAASILMGILIGALGWLPQMLFLRETVRAEGLGAAGVRGAFGNPGEAVAALLGPQGVGVADAEGSASVGFFSLLLLVFRYVPSGRRRRRVWWASISAALFCVLMSWERAAGLLAHLSPMASLFHDPRRWLGVASWFCILAGSLSLDALAWGRFRKIGQTFLAAVACSAITTACLGVVLWQWGNMAFRSNSAAPLFWQGLHIPAFVCLVLLKVPSFRRFAIIGWGAFLLELALLAYSTHATTPLEFLSARTLTHPENPPLLAQAGLKPGERFITVDWHDAYSYDYRRPDLTDWMLPNLGMIFGYEDLGGYEPARSARYERHFGDRGWAKGQRPWPAHFSLFRPDGRSIREGLAAIIWPSMGYPAYPHDAGSGISWCDFTFEESRLEWSFGCFGEPDLSVRDGAWISASDAPPDPEMQRADWNNMFTRNVTWRLLKDPQRPGLLERALFRCAEGESSILGVFGRPENSEALYPRTASRGLVQVSRLEGSHDRINRCFRMDADYGENAFVVSELIQACRLEVDVDLPEPDPQGDFLEIYDAYWTGWKASVDGKSVAADAFNDPWISVKVPHSATGIRHRIVLRYSPPGLYSALALTGLGLAFAALLTSSFSSSLPSWLRPSSSSRRAGRRRST